MGTTVDAILTNKLTKQDILTLPNRLYEKRPLNRQDEHWDWQDKDIDERFLVDYWKRDSDWYINELNSKEYDKIYKDAIIWGPDNHIHFFEPNLTIISSDWKWISFKTDKVIKNKVTNDIIRLAEFLDADKIVMTYNIVSGETDQERDGTNYGDLTTLINVFTKTNRDFEIIELKNTMLNNT